MPVHQTTVTSVNSSGEATPALYIDGAWFKDDTGRTVMLRGVNLSGSSKVPAYPPINDEATLYDHRAVSFVNRPFPLAEADEHFARLRAWGLTFVRLIVTWEAVEHAAPGTYDEAYLDYLAALVARAHEYGILLFIDMHQDAWSRLSGGDGAPGWTFEAVGFDVSNFRSTAAANIYPFDAEPFVVHWQTNYNRLAAATMFTLFFGGNVFAPRTHVDGEPVQSFLQRHYFGAVKQVAHRLQGAPNVVGFGTMNEPSTGFIGRRLWAQNPELHTRRLGVSPTPFQGMLLGAGYPQTVEVWGLRPGGLHRVRRIHFDPAGSRVWQAGQRGVWYDNDVWDIAPDGTPRLLRPHHFTHIWRDGSSYRVDFGRDFLRPFVKRFAAEVRSVEPEGMLFVEQVPRLEMPYWAPGDTTGMVNASHWYDIQTLFLRVFLPFVNTDIMQGRLIFGYDNVLRLFTQQLAAIKRASDEQMHGVPTLIGEFGTSFNMPLKLNYALRLFGLQEWALDTCFRALEANLLNATIWNYTADNSNRGGDGWNTEDMSIFSHDQQRGTGTLDDGGRALRAVVRPYPLRTAGTPQHLSFDMRQRTLMYTFTHDPTIQQPTELFIPQLHFAPDYTVAVTDGTYERQPAQQRLHYWHSPDRTEHTIWVQAH